MRKRKWMPTIYLAQPMTNYKWPEVRATAWKVAKLFKKRGIRVVSPVLQEKIPKNKKQMYTAVAKNIVKEWDLDKHPRIGMCHGIYVVPGNKFSNGVLQERGYTRWFLWRKVWSFVPKKEHFFSITVIEEDGIVHSHDAAARLIKKQIGTRKKWMLWKLKHILSLPKFIWIQVKSIWV
jgi:hypothetical protein